MDQKEVVKKANAWATHNAEWKTKMPELRKIIASGKRPKGSVPPGFSEVGKKKAKVGSPKKPAHKAEAKAAKAMVSMGFSNPYPKKMQVTPREKISKNSDEFSGSDLLELFLFRQIPTLVIFFISPMFVQQTTLIQGCFTKLNCGKNGI